MSEPVILRKDIPGVLLDGSGDEVDLLENESDVFFRPTNTLS